MQKRNYKNFKSLPGALVLLSICCMLCCFACGEKPGDPEKFTVISIDELTAQNPPKGVVFRDGKISLAEGYEMVHSPDSTQALFIDPDKDEGKWGMRCDCDGLVTIGCIVTLEGIITCKNLLCSTSCKPKLLQYGGFISVDRFREAAKNRK